MLGDKQTKTGAAAVTGPGLEGWSLILTTDLVIIDQPMGRSHAMTHPAPADIHHFYIPSDKVTPIIIEIFK